MPNRRHGRLGVPPQLTQHEHDDEPGVPDVLALAVGFIVALVVLGLCGGLQVHAHIVGTDAATGDDAGVTP